MNFLKKIVSFGLSGIEVYHDKRAIALTNYISLILSGILIVLFIVRWTVYRHISTGIDTDFFLLGLSLFIVPIIFNKLNWTVLSRLFICIAPICFLWLLFISKMQELPSVDITMHDTLRIYLLVFSLIPYLLFDKSNLPILGLAILPSFLSFLFFENILTFFDVNHGLQGLATDDYQLMPMRSFMAYLFVSMACYSFQTIITLSDKYNRRILSELQSQSDEIEAQNEELIQSQDKLNEFNIHLEELVSTKTQNILDQNKVLLKYAHANAHYVRGPVARLLGLVRLSKIDTTLDYPLLFSKIECEIKEMDIVIKEQSDELNRLIDKEDY
ncbi:MAG TPA: hypothetical protein PKL31_09710 [Fulvivirga sp.]|nr:hypothetical protein [Fulvivirga sp.]